MGKPTKAEYEQRITEIYDLLLDGASRSEIHQHAAEKWGANERSADALIAQARQRIEADAAAYRASAFAEHIAFRRKLRREAQQSGDGRLALEAARDESKLLSLYDSELLRRIEELEKRLNNDDSRNENTDSAT